MIDAVRAALTALDPKLPVYDAKLVDGNVLSNDVGTNRLGHLVTIGVRKMPNTFED
jgi:hypothetical protein